MKKVVLEGRRADVSWGHLSVDGIEHATEIFGKAVWDTNDAAVMDPNLIVRITVEATWRPVVAGSIWKGKHDGLERVVLAIEGGGLNYQRVCDGTHHYATLDGVWYSDFIWVSDP